MVTKTLELLDQEEFEKYEVEAKFPSNIPASITTQTNDKVQLAKDAVFEPNMSDSELISQIENHGEILADAQNRIIDFALSHMTLKDEPEKEVTKKELSRSAYETILKQYEDDLNGVKVGKN